MVVSLLLLTFVIQKSHLARGAPVLDRREDYSNEETVGWYNTPNQRDTYDLITSCLLTLALCVWSAMHLNVPPYGEPYSRFWIRNLKWILLGVFGPELVCFAAWKQLASARALLAEVRECIKLGEGFESEETVGGATDTDGSQHGRRMSVQKETATQWTIVHALYAGMGGFSFEFDPSIIPDRASFSPEKRRLIFTARGIALLARCGHIPDITKADIVDKSKADGIAKGIVLLQATWFVIQMIARVAQHLPVTLLEVNTLGHVFSAFVVYMLWWNKPRMIQEPTKLTGPWIQTIGTFMYMSSQISGEHRRREGLLRLLVAEAELNGLVYSQELGTFRLREEIDTSAGRKKVTTTTEKKPADLRIEREATCITERLTAADGTSMHLRRWQLAAQAVREYPPLLDLAEALQPRSTDTKDNDPLTLDLAFPYNKHEELVKPYIDNWSAKGTGLLQGVEGKLIGMILWFASMIFGGIHAAAWYDHFPTPVEAWMWRASALWITTSGLIWVLANMTAKLSRRIDDLWEKLLAMKTGRFVLAFFIVLCTICGFAYIIARLFLVVEAFLSIRKLPVRAYDTPDWDVWVPHL